MFGRRPRKEKKKKTNITTWQKQQHDVGNLERGRGPACFPFVLHKICKGKVRY